MSLAVARKLGTTHVGLQNVAIRYWRSGPKPAYSLSEWNPGL
jgi:hypothetical protein